jgi:hypothetical protein
LRREPTAHRLRRASLLAQRLPPNHDPHSAALSQTAPHASTTTTLVTIFISRWFLSTTHEENCSSLDLDFQGNPVGSQQGVLRFLTS